LKDPETSSKARVTNGKLRVGDANGPLTVDGAVESGDETELVETASLVLQDGDSAVFPFDATGYEQLRLTFQAGTLNEGNVTYDLQQTSPDQLTVVSGSLSGNANASEVVEVPGREMRLFLYSFGNNNLVKFTLYGR
jgi:hypothetical protein